jgi:hypothetical protein
VSSGGPNTSSYEKLIPNSGTHGTPGARNRRSRVGRRRISGQNEDPGAEDTADAQSNQQYRT